MKNGKLDNYADDNLIMYIFSGLKLVLNLKLDFKNTID